VSDRLDVLRSLLRAGADRAGRGARRLGGVDAFRKALHDLRRQRIPVRDEALTAAVAHAPGVEAATASARDEAVHVDASFRDGTHLHLGLYPDGARFAPRGAKELRFRIEPAELARDRRARELTASIAGAVARSLWAMLLQRAEGQNSVPIVDRDGDGRLRVDLRTIPALRKIQSRGPIALMLEALEVRAMRVEPGALVLEIGLPHVPI